MAKSLVIVKSSAEFNLVSFQWRIKKERCVKYEVQIPARAVPDGCPRQAGPGVCVSMVWRLHGAVTSPAWGPLITEGRTGDRSPGSWHHLQTEPCRHNKTRPDNFPRLKLSQIIIQFNRCSATPLFTIHVEQITSLISLSGENIQIKHTPIYSACVCALYL